MRRIPHNFNLFFSVFALAMIFSSCASSRIANTDSGETMKDATSALGAVAGSYSGKEMSEEEKQQALKQIQSDKEAQSALRAIAGSMEGKPHIKYSPATGKRYSGDLEYDPETGVKLLPLEP